jgi:hypothetical protein
MGVEKWITGMTPPSPKNLLPDPGGSISRMRLGHQSPARDSAGEYVTGRKHAASDLG